MLARLIERFTHQDKQIIHTVYEVGSAVRAVNGGIHVGRSVALAYVLWFFLGYLGIHRMYCGRIGSGVVMLALNVLGTLMFPFIIGHLLLFIVGVWWLVDLFLTAGMASRY